MRRIDYAPYKLKMKAAREWGRANGYQGTPSSAGWIYSQGGRVQVQGWYCFFQNFRVQILDDLTRQLTAFDSFDEFTNTDPNYRPTIMPRNWRYAFLADCFDSVMQSRRSDRRVWRGTGA